jgi:hypothetical protein
MKRTKTPTQRKPTPQDLLEKLRKLDEDQLKEVLGGCGRCTGHCSGRCD